MPCKAFLCVENAVLRKLWATELWNPTTRTLTVKNHATLTPVIPFPCSLHLTPNLGEQAPVNTLTLPSSQFTIADKCFKEVYYSDKDDDDQGAVVVVVLVLIEAGTTFIRSRWFQSFGSSKSWMIMWQPASSKVDSSCPDKIPTTNAPAATPAIDPEGESSNTIQRSDVTPRRLQAVK